MFKYYYHWSNDWTNCVIALSVWLIRVLAMRINLAVAFECISMSCEMRVSFSSPFSLIKMFWHFSQMIAYLPTVSDTAFSNDEIISDGLSFSDISVSVNAREAKRCANSASASPIRKKREKQKEIIMFIIIAIKTIIKMFEILVIKLCLH